MNWILPNGWTSASPTSGDTSHGPAYLCDTPPCHGIWVGLIGADNWVGAMSAYNQGRLPGSWVDLLRVASTDDWERALTQLRESGAAGGEVRTRVLDATGLGLHLGQKPTGKAVVAIARVARDLPTDALPAFEAWIDLRGWNPDEPGSEASLEQFRAEYQGSHCSLEAWAREQLRHSGLLDSVPPELDAFIDALGWVRSQHTGELVAMDLEHPDQRVAIFLRA
jgi:hypothetical protein